MSHATDSYDDDHNSELVYLTSWVNNRRNYDNISYQVQNPVNCMFTDPLISNDFMLLFMIMLSKIIINLDIIKQCIKKLKLHKNYGKYGFKSDHIINGSNKLFILLSMMFNAMLTQGFNP